MKSHLKVKVFSLSAEMTFIHRQELKWKEKARAARQRQKEQAVKYCEDNFWSHRWHRQDLKTEARTAHLAYGAMRNVPYWKMEYISLSALRGYNREAPNWEAIVSTIERFSKDEPNRADIMQRFSEWLADAKTWYDGNEKRIPEYWEEMKRLKEARQNDPEHQFERQKKASAARRRAASVEYGAPA